MITPDNLFVTLRGMVNRGYCDPAGIIERTKLSPEIVAEALLRAVEDHFAYKHVAPEAYMLTPWGQLEVENDSLRKLAELSRAGYAPLWD